MWIVQVLRLLMFESILCFTLRAANCFLFVEVVGRIFCFYCCRLTNNSDNRSLSLVRTVAERGPALFPFSFQKEKVRFVLLCYSVNAVNEFEGAGLYTTHRRC